MKKFYKHKDIFLECIYICYNDKNLPKRYELYFDSRDKCETITHYYEQYKKKETLCFYNLLKEGCNHPKET